MARIKWSKLDSKNKHLHESSMVHALDIDTNMICIDNTETQDGNTDYYKGIE